VFFSNPFKTIGKIEFSKEGFTIIDLNEKANFISWSECDDVLLAYTPANNGVMPPGGYQYELCWLKFKYNGKSYLLHYFIHFDLMGVAINNLAEELEKNQNIETLNCLSHINKERVSDWIRNLKSESYESVLPS
jgi:hypothetical protein